MRALFITLMMLGSVWADTTSQTNFIFDGIETSESTNLSTEVTRTEYQEREVTRRCWRTEYRYRCRTVPGRCRDICRAGRCRRVCERPRRVCRNVPVRVPYTCRVRERVPVEVFDYAVETEVRMSYDTQNTERDAFEDFKVTVKGKDVDVSVRDSKKYFIFLDNKEKSESRSRDLLTQKISYSFSFAKASKYTDVLSDGIDDFTMRNRVLSFRLGENFNLKDFKMRLRLYRDRRGRGDILLLDRMINESNIEISRVAGDSLITLDLKQFDYSHPGRLRVVLETEYDDKNRDFLNAESFDLDARVNVLFR